MTAISTTNLTKRFARTSGYRDLLPFRRRPWITAVDGVSLDIERGEFFGLLGPNGAGKTTFIKLLCCLVLPNSGTARVCGRDILKEEHEVRRIVGDVMPIVFTGRIPKAEAVKRHGFDVDIWIDDAPEFVHRERVFVG